MPPFGGDDQRLIRNQTLYNVEDPTRAFNNVLSDIGVNPYAANPYVTSLRRLAPSLTSAFQLSSAMNPQQHSINAGPLDPAGAYGDFMRNALYQSTGGNAGGQNYAANRIQQGQPQGGVYNTAWQARRYFPEALQTVRNQNAALASGSMTADQVNPYVASLNDQMQSDNGRGALSLYASLATPYMNPSMAQAYTRQLGNTYEGQLRNFMNQGSLTGPDMWNYVFGF